MAFTVNPEIRAYLDGETSTPPIISSSPPCQDLDEAPPQKLYGRARREQRRREALERAARRSAEQEQDEEEPYRLGEILRQAMVA